MKKRYSTLMIPFFAVLLTAFGCGGGGGGGGFAPTGKIVAVAERSGSETVVVGGPRGSATPGASVMITNLATTESRETTVSQDGSFQETFAASTQDMFRVEIPDDEVDETIGVTLLRDAVERDIAPVGSAPTDIEIQGERAFVVNGLSNNIQVFDISQNAAQQIGTIALPQGQNPQSIAFIDGSRAALPNFNGQSVAIVNLETFTCEAIVVNQQNPDLNLEICAEIVVIPEAFEEPSGIAVFRGKLWVTNNNLDPNFNPLGNGFVTVIDLDTLSLDGFIESSGANSTSPTPVDGRIWVVNGGNVLFDPETFQFICDDSFPPSIDIIDPASEVLEDAIPLPLSPENPDACLPGALAQTPDGGSVYLGLGLVGALLKVDVPTRTLVNGPADPIVITDLSGLNLAADIVIRSDGIGFITLFNTDQIAAFDTANDEINPFPFIAPFPAGIVADNPESQIISGVQLLALAPQGIFPDIFYVTGLSQQLNSIDTSLVIAP